MPKTLLARVIDRMCAVSGYVSAVLILLAMLVVCHGVLLRYVFGASTVWQTETTIYLVMFASFVGGAYGLRHGDHVRIDLVINMLPPRGQLVMKLVSAVLGTLFTILVTVVATNMWLHTLDVGAHSGTAWNPPLVYPHFILPLGMGLISLQYLMITGRLAHGLFTGATDVQEYVPAESSEGGGAGH